MRSEVSERHGNAGEAHGKLTHERDAEAPWHRWRIQSISGIEEAEISTRPSCSDIAHVPVAWTSGWARRLSMAGYEY
jgi:hypothetical protein